MTPSHLPKLTETLRQRLRRFKTGIHEGYLAPRALRRLEELQQKAQPVVVAVYLRTLLNGWATERRLRTAANCQLSENCPFCSSGKDSLEHFAQCRVVKHCFAKHGLKVTSTETFLGLDLWAMPDRILLIARLLSALYTARNTLVHSAAETPEEVLRFACQLVN